MRTLKIILIPTLMLGLTLSCVRDPDKATMEKWQQEIRDTERDFAAMAKSEGIPAAFLAYAADSAVLMRNNNIVKGKNKMSEYFKAQPLDMSQVSLSWEPEFVEVARSGDLGYTYGPFVFSITDSTGVTLENKGVFHTVWKRQEDGSWKFVWD